MAASGAATRLHFCHVRQVLSVTIVVILCEQIEGVKRAKSRQSKSAGLPFIRVGKAHFRCWCEPFRPPDWRLCANPQGHGLLAIMTRGGFNPGLIGRPTPFLTVRTTTADLLSRAVLISARQQEAPDAGILAETGRAGRSLASG